MPVPKGTPKRKYPPKTPAEELLSKNQLHKKRKAEREGKTWAQAVLLSEEDKGLTASKRWSNKLHDQSLCVGCRKPYVPKADELKCEECAEEHKIKSKEWREGQTACFVIVDGAKCGEPFRNPGAIKCQDCFEAWRLALDCFVVEGKCEICGLDRGDSISPRLCWLHVFLTRRVSPTLPSATPPLPADPPHPALSQNTTKFHRSPLGQQRSAEYLLAKVGLSLEDATPFSSRS